MTPNNNHSVIPFYDSKERQNHRKSYVFGDVFPLICPNRKILPFQIIRPKKVTGINRARLWDLKTETYVDILSDMNAAGLTVKAFTGESYDIIVNPSVLLFPERIMTAGQYYLEIGDGTYFFTSEVFTVVDDVSQFMKMTFYDKAQILFSGGHMDYSNGFRNFMYISTEIGRPEYETTEEVSNNDGELFVEKQISKKIYKFKMLAPEYLCDLLRLVRLHDHVSLELKNEQYDTSNINFEVKWLERGDIADVNVEFETDTVVKKIGKGVIEPATGGDFSNDFSNDFDL